MPLSRPDPLLAGLTPRQFVARHWQKRPLLVRQAVAGVEDLLSLDQLMQLATRDDVQARVVIRAGRSFELRHGPFTRAFLRGLKGRCWTLLVQEVNHHLPQARALLDRFAFIPYARLDDVMVSYAAPGGGVGPHFDSYDVFLLQGRGRRRWRISRQADLSLVRGAPLRILRRFRPEQEWVLDAGDMLYLPPSCAHDGVALEECMTYSVGFRAPSWQELTEQFLVHLQDSIARQGMYADSDLEPQTSPARIPPRMIAKVEATLARIRWSKQDVMRFLGRYLTEPKPHVFFSPPPEPLSLAAFCRRAGVAGVSLDLRTQMLYSAGCFFINGEMLQADASVARALRELADRRRLDSRRALPRELVQRLHAWYTSGCLHIGPTSAQDRQ
jgi:50S ribosomal protein L16 3-hydroxylase